MDASNYRTPTVEEAYTSHADMLFRIAYSVLKSREDAEDAVADVFSRYIKKAPVFNDAEHEKAWLLRVALNICKDLQRRRMVRSYTPLHEMTDIPSEQKFCEDILCDVMELPEKQRTVILLHYFEDLSIEQIAHALKLTKSAVKMRLHRGRELIKENSRGGE